MYADLMSNVEGLSFHVEELGEAHSVVDRQEEIEQHNSLVSKIDSVAENCTRIEALSCEIRNIAYGN
jgi:hypothetical protein